MSSILNLIIPAVQFSVFLILFAITRNNILKILAILGMVVSVFTFIILCYALNSLSAPIFGWVLNFDRIFEYVR